MRMLRDKLNFLKILKRIQNQRNKAGYLDYSRNECGEMFISKKLGMLSFGEEKRKEY